MKQDVDMEQTHSQPDLNYFRVEDILGSLLTVGAAVKINI